MELKRCVITGIGPVSPIGTGKDKFWDSLKNGVSGARKVTRFDISPYPSQVAAEVPDFEVTDYMDKKVARRSDLVQQFSVAATKLAIEDAGLDLEKIDREMMGVVYGSGVGGISTFENQIEVLLNKGPGRVSPFFIPMMIADMTAGLIALTYGLKGPNYATLSACASSSNALADAYQLIRTGDADIMVAGGAEAAVTPASFAGFCSAKAISTRNDAPEKASRPFDAGRDGFVIGEGACTLILESQGHAEKRGAHIYAEIIGAGLSCDAYHITAPAPGGEGAARAMKAAMRNSGLAADDIDYINTHGTSTDLGDIAETEAIKTVFGERAYKIPANSTKSMIGHLLGAAGAMEAAAVCLSMQNKYLHPTINLENPDEKCDLDYVALEGRDQEINYAISNSFGFGGHNVTLALKKIE
ncbi:MAG: beta-ketoacyl-ACP synthase II [candidate division Zixibacteria bacterium]|nr:beta-ketoacyl-ACP synthase II [candidate division Zixibacteria bacterium]NIR63317.1 beta-ketoacyl-ACP synthase II [candidate division Zixibacteria bacterium]NIS17312.1 beta-ketoacyl-ACP synthase II [candidate division Zixibacteria bacterium]NIS45302.1 beta-ketoacyl-ACP synthase II [candidate division Zixibacteria bacterium]NIT53672.1 beta-ketoacyl-ACP synthase II [candidate division Zixibacteria bacterium]